MSVFQMDEFIKIAIKDEETGRAFYTALAETTQNEILKASYQKIADQEKHHEENFKKMLSSIHKSHHFEQYTGQYEDFMNAMLQSRAFSTPEEAAAEAKHLSAGEAIDKALTMEKDTLLFYLDMKEWIPDTHKKYVEEIINEERGHVRDLTELKQQIK